MVTTLVCVVCSGVVVCVIVDPLCAGVRLCFTVADANISADVVVTYVVL